MLHFHELRSREQAPKAGWVIRDPSFVPLSLFATTDQLVDLAMNTDYYRTCSKTSSASALRKLDLSCVEVMLVWKRVPKSPVSYRKRKHVRSEIYLNFSFSFLLPLDPVKTRIHFVTASHNEWKICFIPRTLNTYNISSPTSTTSKHPSLAFTVCRIDISS